ncbi:hypothetical protein [Neisseria lactamica]|uniref:hypothetical protein n=1 Tax=Neisseria lactamica TaxID=486 RepID=UPI0012904175|nr:hypothetical protein [Neisseria lactamica]
MHSKNVQGAGCGAGFKAGFKADFKAGCPAGCRVGFSPPNYTKLHQSQRFYRFQTASVCRHPVGTA